MIGCLAPGKDAPGDAGKQKLWAGGGPQRAARRASSKRGNPVKGEISS